jgi:SSS family solute:Na+ symporter
LTLGTLDAVIVVAYLAGMLGVGVWVSRRIAGFDDFFVAGRRMSTPVLVATLVSTYYGLDVTFGTSETAYLEGVSAFVAYSAPFYAAYIAMAMLIAPRLRALPARSMPEVMEHHYGRGARVWSASASFVYSAPILSVAGMGLIGEVFFGLDAWIGSVVGAAATLVYTVLGGLLADAITDAFQFTLMCVTMGAAAVFAMLEIGGPAELAARLPAATFAPLGSLSAGEVVIYASVALTPLVEPAFYQRAFAARGGREIVRALLIGVVLWMAYDWLVVYLGVAGQDLVARGALPADTDASAILLHTLAELLPAGLLGLFLAGCAAAAMSTIDSYSLIAAGNIVYDVWPIATGRALSDRQLLRWTRVLTAVTMAFALWTSLQFERLRDAWIFMATVLLSTTLVPMGAALFVLRSRRPRAGTWSAAVGLLSSLGLFVAFLVAGVAHEDTVALDLGGALLVREEAVFVTTPASLVAFLVGYLVDRHEEEAA